MDEINIKVYLSSSNRLIYQGTDLHEATFTAKTSGQHCHMVMIRGDATATYHMSPERPQWLT